MNLARLEVAGPDGVQTLTPQEGALLSVLERTEGAPVPRSEILREVWGPHTTEPRVIDHAVTRLREKIETDPGRPRWLRTVRGVGFSLHRSGQIDQSLPYAIRYLVGRDSVLASLGQPRGWVTITGPGGVGKTAVAIQAAHQSAKAMFVDLSAQKHAEEVHRAVAFAMGIRGQGDVLRQIAVASGLFTLVVLDNCEQLQDGALSDLHRVLGAERVPVLATSRRRLGLTEEKLVELQPLEPEEASGLFLKRAQQAGVSKNLDPQAVEAMVDALDRLPLAIELAARRLGVVPLKSLQQKLQDSLGILQDTQAAEKRHQGLTTAIAWSWELLSATERQALSTLALLESSFSFETACLILEDEGQCLTALTEHHLVAHRDPRFHLLSTIRRFALGRLETPSAAQDQVALALVARVRGLLPGEVDQEYNLPKLLSEMASMPDLLRARKHLQDQPGRAFWLSAAIVVLQSEQGAASELETMVAMLDELEGDPQAIGCWTAAWSAHLSGAREDCAMFASRGVQAATGHLLPNLQVVLALASLELGRWDVAESTCNEVLTSPSATPHQRTDALVVLARTAFYQGDVDAASARLDEADALNVKRTEVDRHGMRAQLHARLGDQRGARQHLEKARTSCERPVDATLIEVKLAELAYLDGRLAEAEQLADCTVTELQRTGRLALLGVALSKQVTFRDYFYNRYSDTEYERAAQLLEGAPERLVWLRCLWCISSIKQGDLKGACQLANVLSNLHEPQSRCFQARELLP